jgi:flagellar assembly protein FliH
MMSLSNIYKSVSYGEVRPIQVTSPQPKRIIAEHPPENTAHDIIQQAVRKAEAIHSEAERERVRVLEQLQRDQEAWQSQKESEREKARQEGYEEGFRQGIEKAEAEWVHRLEEAKRLIQLAEEDYKKHLDESERVLLDLAIAISGRIVTQVLASDPEAWIDLVKRAIRDVKDQTVIQVHVSPVRYEATLAFSETLQAASHDARIQIFPDESLRENDCYIETPYGRVDASVDRQLSIIKQKLKEFLEADLNGN